MNTQYDTETITLNKNIENTTKSITEQLGPIIGGFILVILLIAFVYGVSLIIMQIIGRELFTNDIIPANIKDALNWSTLTANKGYKITQRIPNIRRYHLDSGVNQYNPQNDLYQAFILTSIKNPQPQYSLTYIVPMNVAGKDINTHQFIASDNFNKINRQYPLYVISNKVLLQAAPDGREKVSYFLIDRSSGNLETLNISITESPPANNETLPLYKFSPWVCLFSLAQEQGKAPQGYKYYQFDGPVYGGQDVYKVAPKCILDREKHRPRYRAIYKRI